MTKLGQVVSNKAAGGTPPSPAASLLRRTFGVARGEVVDVPSFGRMYIELLGAVAAQEVESEVQREMTRLQLALDMRTEPRYELERAWRTLARAARDPDNHAALFGTVDEWGQLDETLISVAWSAYADVKERLDPLAGELTEDELVMINVALKKKDPALWRTFGLNTLSRWLASLDDRPSTSPPPSSPPTESLLDSSS